VARRVCDLENPVNEEAKARVGPQRHVKKIIIIITIVIIIILLSLVTTSGDARRSGFKFQTAVLSVLCVK
jgi:hypothetical protein